MNMTIHYRTLRKAIGICAFLFPILLVIFGGGPLRGSLSAYYWSPASDIFVGLLVTMGVFLITYNGFDDTDKWLTSIAGVSMILVALFPFATEGFTPNFLGATASGFIHGAAATLTFGALGIMSLTQFTKSYNIARNRVYRFCGCAIFVVMASMIPVKIFIPDSALFFFQEVAVLQLFGVSWVVKGLEYSWRD